jgi:peptide/nickel transport system ATP-binding protein
MVTRRASSPPVLAPAPNQEKANPDTVLAVEDLVVRFKDVPQPVIDGVSFTLTRGRTLAIVGESGSGKSITALALMGLLPPVAFVARGTAVFGTIDLLQLRGRAQADLRGDRVAMIFQEPMTSLNPVLRIGDQIAESVRRHRGVSQAAGLKRALEMLDRVRVAGAAQRLNAYPHELSGGMRQRVMIAMALANDPQLLIADEPTTALDVTIQAQILALLAELQAEMGTAVVFITHDLGVVAEVADDMAVMYAGRMVETGPPARVFEDPQHPYTIGLLGSLPSFGRREGRLATIPGNVPQPHDMSAACRFAPRCPFVMPDCTAVRPALIDVGEAHRAACFAIPIDGQGGPTA